MPVIPSIQSLVGAHSGGVSIGLDWTANRAFELSGTNLSRYGLLSGLEEAYTPLANMAGVGQSGIAAHIGITASGDIFISSSGSLYNGGAMLVDGDTLAMTNLIGYPAPNFGQGGMVGVTYGTTQYCVDKGLGDSIIGTLNRIQEISSTTWLDTQDFTGEGGRCCAGPAGDGTAYIISRNSASTQAILSKITFNGGGFVSNATVGSPLVPSDVDPGWSLFGPGGVCLDQTDGKLLAVFQGVGNSNKAYLVKIDPADATIDWASVIPATDGGGPVVPGDIFAHSSIQHQRIGFYSGSPPTVTIYDTSDGSVEDQYSTSLSGLSSIDGQCYNDTKGCIVLGCDFSNDPSSPTLLNSTPTSWSDGYAVLYVAAGTGPTPGNGNRRWLAAIKSVRAA